MSVIWTQTVVPIDQIQYEPAILIYTNVSSKYTHIGYCVKHHTDVQDGYGRFYALTNGVDNDGLKEIAQQLSDFTSPLDVMERTLKHERKVTAVINWMYQIAFEESDYPAQMMFV